MQLLTSELVSQIGVFPNLAVPPEFDGTDQSAQIVLALLFCFRCIPCVDVYLVMFYRSTTCLVSLGDTAEGE